MIRISYLGVCLLVDVAKCKLIKFHKRYKTLSYLIAHCKMIQNAGKQQAKGSLLEKWKCAGAHK